MEGSFGKRVLYCFRTDKERTEIHRPLGNTDLSKLFKFGTEAPMQAFCATSMVFRFVNHYEEVRTNRLHVAVAGALQGKRVKFYPNSYFKNEAVYNYSMKERFPNMHHIPSIEMPEITWENYIVARLDGRVVGFAGYKILSETEAKTELMVVDPVCQGKGVGLRLQTSRMEEIAVLGIRTLITNSDLPASIAWYKKHFGYEEVGRLKKEREFGGRDIDCWTTLRVDLQRWANKRKGADDG